MMSIKELDTPTEAIDKARLRLQAIAEKQLQIDELERQTKELLRQSAEFAAVRQRMVAGTEDLTKAVLLYEGELIRVALQNAGGAVTRAAKHLNMSYQGLAYIIASRHPELANVRTPVHHRNKRAAERIGTKEAVSQL